MHCVTNVMYFRHWYWYYMHIMVYPLHCYEFILNLCLVRMYYMYVPMYSMYACKQNKFPEMDNKIELNWIELLVPFWHYSALFVPPPPPPNWKYVPPPLEPTPEKHYHFPQVFFSHANVEQPPMKVTPPPPPPGLNHRCAIVLYQNATHSFTYILIIILFSFLFLQINKQRVVCRWDFLSSKP